MDALAQLAEIRSQSGKKQTQGLDLPTISRFLSSDPSLAEAIHAAYVCFKGLSEDEKKVMQLDESEQIKVLQKNFVNFYAEELLNPFVSLAAQGPWLITTGGAVIYDAGAYGMLGFGHSPKDILEALEKPGVMLNIMTANFAQKKLADALLKEIGYSRKGAGKHCFSKFICMNSGSEAVTVAARIADIQAKIQTDPSGKHAKKKIMFLSMKGSFHGRTERPAQASHSSESVYKKYLASFQGLDRLYTVEPNDVGSLKRAFHWAQENHVYFDMALLEPVQGEGNPGCAITAEFYACARELCTKHDTLLLVDSIQAGFRAQGCLSVVDYPGFEELAPPDMEVYSKALNAGQFPLSVLALGDKAASLYKTGVYGNTMTGNPRALNVGSAVLERFTLALRRNIQERGREFLSELKKLAEEFPQVVSSVQGTGLLFSVGIREERFQVVAQDGLETLLRKAGLGVIHGGKNALRFTPVFTISSEQVKLVVALLRAAFEGGASHH
ncbi:MAG: aminotransferase class III-fold pyridoxal phosphate-dependent enzyme [Oligoflexales bacterium]|nr:aminotransferase class III-fold pyridoxal phosphate-dependent enzyme [Oligoflexales bacterium]